jgi:hypothetical protein
MPRNLVFHDSEPLMAVTLHHREQLLFGGCLRELMMKPTIPGKAIP